MTYQVYTPVDSTNGEIRILRIQPAKKESDEIQCEFIPSLLNNLPEYEALSYTWGGPAPDPGKFILLNFQRFPIFENLFAALLRLRQTYKPRTIWIDAICINQSMAQEAVREREQQILLMKRIYEQARQVVIWLGDTGIGERIAMQSLANPSGSFSLGTKIWKTERKFGLGKGLKSRMSQGLSGEWDPKALEVGELSQLLDRKWWRRVWIVQEVVLARKAVIMCGPDEVPWEAITKRMRDGMYGILGQDRNQRAKHMEEGSVIAKYAFPDAEYITLMALQEKWRSKTWDRTLYNLLYTFRRFEATVPRDRIYAFLGLASDIKTLSIIPDYSSPTSKIFTDVARAMIIAHKHLLLFNLKREPVMQRQNTQQQSQIYSLLDQIRFLDPDGLVAEGEGRPPRKGWARLPHGWERRQDGSRFCFYNHLTKEYQDTSPLADQPPTSPQHMDHWRSLPLGWIKTWDNLGNTQFVFNPDALKSDQPKDTELENLPSWVPDWTKWSSKDSKPFPSLIAEEPRYWASGKARQVHFASGYDSDSQTLKLTGVLFDKIVSLARPWCPELHLLPIDRLENKTLQEWEDLATIPVPNCPYEKSGGRYNAYWRTHIADYASARSATDKDENYFETWANRGAWASRVQDNFSATDKSSWQKNFETPTEQQIMNNMWIYMMEKGYETPSLNPATNRKLISESQTKYKELRKRIHSASIGRAMFVTSKGFIGLGPWNAQEGDVVSVLFGGCTPFILRKTAGKELYILVGEAYVYGIMGGELFSGEMGHPRLRAFDIV
jgi:hypothetical protein